MKMCCFFLFHSPFRTPFHHSSPFSSPALTYNASTIICLTKLKCFCQPWPVINSLAQLLLKLETYNGQANLVDLLVCTLFDSCNSDNPTWVKLTVPFLQWLYILRDIYARNLLKINFGTHTMFLCMTVKVLTLINHKVITSVTGLLIHTRSYYNEQQM